MNNYEEILSKAPLKSFKAPDGYFDTLEERLDSAVFGKRDNTVMRIFKPALALACSFVAVFGIGYGVLSLTGTAEGGDAVLSGDNFDISMLVAPAYFNFDDESLDVVEEAGEEEILEYFTSGSAANSYLYHQLASIE